MAEFVVSGGSGGVNPEIELAPLILLDTNIIPAGMRLVPDSGVIRRLNRANVGWLCIATTSIAEILYGLDLLPSGRRRLRLEDQVKVFLLKAFNHRILSFDKAAVRH